MKLPDTIRSIVDQAGGTGMTGAFCYVGASQYVYLCPKADGEYRSGYKSHVAEQGDGSYTVKFGVGLRFKVNGKRGAGWYMVIAYEPDDTYTVWLVENRNNRNPSGMVLECMDDVYCDILKEVIEGMYDRALNNYCEGVVPF